MFWCIMNEQVNFAALPTTNTCNSTGPEFYAVFYVLLNSYCDVYTAVYSIKKYKLLYFDDCIKV